MKILLALFLLLGINCNGQEKTARDYVELAKEYELSDPDSVLKLCTKAIALDSTYAEAYFQLGMRRWYLDIKTGTEEFTKAIELNPDYAAAYNMRGEIYVFNFDYESALKDFSSAIRIAPKESYYWLNRGRIRSEQGKFREAIEDLNESLKLSPDFIWARSERAHAKHQILDFKGAIDDYVIALEGMLAYDFNDANATGDCYYILGDLDNACKYWGFARELEDEQFLEEGGAYINHEAQQKMDKYCH